MRPPFKEKIQSFYLFYRLPRRVSFGGTPLYPSQRSHIFQNGS
jgi:hypothetical protein